MLFTVYILYSPVFTKIYIGYTSNLLQRFKSHNHLGTKGHTVKYRPWVVVYCEYFDEKRDAILREKQLKDGKGRAWIHQKLTEDFIPHGFISA